MKGVGATCVLVVTALFAASATVTTVEGSEPVTLPPRSAFHATDKVYRSSLYDAADSWGLGSWVNFAFSIKDNVGVGQPDYFKVYVNGEFSAEFGDGYWMDYLLPAMIVGGLGIAFGVIWGIVGMCFGCCRCSGNCGAEMSQRGQLSGNFRRAIMFFLAVSILFVFVGSIALYLGSARLTNNGPAEIEVAIDNFLWDLRAYIDNMYAHADFALDQFGNVLVALDDALDSAAGDVGVEAQSLVSANGAASLISRLQTFGTDVGAMASATAHLAAAVGALDGQWADVTAAVDAFREETDELQARCDAAHGAGGCAGVPTTALDVDFSGAEAAWGLAGFRDLMATVDGYQFGALATSAQAELDRIPSRLADGTRDDVTKVKADIAAHYADTRAEVDKVYNDMLDAYTDIEVEVKERWDEYLGKDSDGDRYLGYAQVAGKIFATVCLGASLLAFLGLLCGFLGGFCDGSRVSPGGKAIKAPSGMSKHGGNWLMASVGFAFFFGTFMWVLTGVLVVLSLLGSEVCSTWEAPDRPVVPGVLDRADGEFFNTIGKLVYDQEDIDNGLTYLFDDFFRNCALGLTPYVSMGLEAVFEISKKLDFADPDVYGGLNGLTGNFDADDVGDITLLAADEQSRVSTDLPGAVIPSGRLATVSAQVSGGGGDGLLTTSTNSLRTQLDSFSPPDSSGAVNDQIDSVRNAIDTLENALADAVTQHGIARDALADLSALYDKEGGIAARAAQYQADYTSFEAWKNAQLADLISAFVQSNTVDGMLANTEAYRLFVVDFLQNDFGVCAPLITAMDSLHGSVCVFWWSGLDVFWFSLGWICFWYLPMVILSVKLAKHFRRVQISDAASSPLGQIVNAPQDESFA